MEQPPHKCIQEERIRALEEDKAETKVYVKLIREDIQEMKNDLKKLPIQGDSSAAKAWSPIVTELIKLVGLAITILGVIVGAVKILGK
jgi:hypothetical protein